MRVKRMFMATMAAMIVMTGASQTESFASSGKGSGHGGANTVAGSVTRFVAKLVPSNPKDPMLAMFEGHAALRAQGTRKEFEARVEVPRNALGQTPDTLKLDLLSGGGNRVAECTMEIDGEDAMLDTVEYKVSIRSRSDVVSNRTGFCGLEAQPQIPGVGDGIVASVTVGGVALSGMFVSKP